MFFAPPLTRSSHAALPLLAVAVSLVAQNLGAAVAKSIFPLVGAQGVTALRVGLAACLFLAFGWRRIRFERENLGNLAFYGVALGSMNLTFYQALARIPVGVATAIEIMGPLAVVLATSRHARDFLWLGLAVIGLLLLLPLQGASASLDPVGLAFAAAAAVCWALYIVFGKRVSTRPDGSAVALGMTIAALFTVPLGLAQAGGALLSPVVLLTGLGIALLSSALPYSLEMVALRRVPPQIFGMLVSASPAVGALAGYVVLGERLAAVQWIAIACIAIASAGSAAGSPGPRPSESTA